MRVCVRECVCVRACTCLFVCLCVCASDSNSILQFAECKLLSVFVCVYVSICLFVRVCVRIEPVCVCVCVVCNLQNTHTQNTHRYTHGANRNSCGGLRAILHL